MMREASGSRGSPRISAGPPMPDLRCALSIEYGNTMDRGTAKACRRTTRAAPFP